MNNKICLLVILISLTLTFTSDLERAPEQFSVKFTTTLNKTITFRVFRKWAPYGADRFYTLCKERYYNDNGFFRVVPNFVVQFGINGDPKVSAKWRDKTIPGTLANHM